MASQDCPEYGEKLKMFDNVLDLNFIQDPLTQTVFSEVNKEQPAVWLKNIVIERLSGLQIFLRDKNNPSNKV